MYRERGITLVMPDTPFPASLDLHAALTSFVVLQRKNSTRFAERRQSTWLPAPEVASAKPVTMSLDLGEMGHKEEKVRPLALTRGRTGFTAKETAGHPMT